jgi:hypothetical protein
VPAVSEVPAGLVAEWALEAVSDPAPAAGRDATVTSM